MQLATEVAATASPTVRAKSRRVITRHMFDGRIWTCKSSAQVIARLTWPVIKSYICRVVSVALLMML